MKRILAFFCMLVMVASLLNPAVFAQTEETVITLEADTSNMTVTGDTYIDLNGHSIDGVTVTGGTLYCMDSQTADYTVADGVYGKVTNITGQVEAASGYLAVEEKVLSFHRVNLDIYAMTLRANEVGVYYKSYFEADEVVATRVESFGVALSVVAAPTAENLETYCGYSEFTDFAPGKEANTVGTSTLLKGIMKAANQDAKNAANANLPIYGSAYIKTADGYFFGETVKRSFRQQLEAVDAAWDRLTKAQKAPVRELVKTYAAVVSGWNIPNILAPAPLIESEEFIYGSYFDHDRFPGNTGTRLLSGDYGKIRSADALLPAQQITIRVKDTDLSNYKVTLGYYTKDGIYTGRTGILPMQDGELTITAGEMRGAYFRVNVYIYNGRFTKVPDTAQILVYGEKAPLPEQPDEPTSPETPPVQPDTPTNPDQPETPTNPDRPWEGKKIAVVGDSISTGSYPGIVANLTGATLQNLSVSGSKLSGTGAKSLVNLVKGVAADADLVIVFGGTNDYWHKGTHIGAADATDANTYVGALRTILTYLQANHPQAKYLFVFPADQTFSGNSSDKDFGYGTLQNFREAFLQFCVTNNVPHVDIGATEFDSAKHSGDGVHPNSAGHTIIANAIYERIAAGL